MAMKKATTHHLGAQNSSNSFLMEGRRLWIQEYPNDDPIQISRSLGFVATTSKQAWSTLQKEFQGDSKVIVVKLQSLRRDFETLYMKNGESIADFLSRVLRSLTPKFDHVVAAIEESKDLSVFSFDELMGSLQAHETRINRSLKKNEEKAFQVKDIVTKVVESDSSTNKGRGRGRGRFDGQR
ncbi:hypothetical protein CsSME_00019913 [Camellia sinensis var. sinensis]